MATYIVTFSDGRDDNEVTADWVREDPPFVEFMVNAEGSSPRIIAQYRDENIMRIERNS